MKLLDVLKKETIITNLKSNDKRGIINELVASVSETAGIEEETLIQVLLEREQLGSTGIGGGIGIPHGKLKELDHLVLGFGLSRKGVDFESMDGKPTYVFFLLITPENSTGLHLKLLAQISRLLKKDIFKQSLMNATSRDEIIKIIEQEDEEF